MPRLSRRQKINAIAQKAADDVFALRAKHLEARKQIVDTLAAPTVDRAKLEALRADQMKLAETATKRVTDAVADIADVLTPAQRADLGQRVERWQRWLPRLGFPALRPPGAGPWGRAAWHARGPALAPAGPAISPHHGRAHPDDRRRQAPRRDGLRLSRRGGLSRDDRRAPARDGERAAEAREPSTR